MKVNRSLFLAACIALLLSFVAADRAPASEIQKAGEVTQGQLQPPSIFSPSERSEVRGIFKMAFSWSGVPKAAGYHIVLARDRRFRNIVYENSKIPNTVCSVDNLGYGTYFFKISSVASDGNEGPFSEVRTFIVAPPPPAKGPEPISNP